MTHHARRRPRWARRLAVGSLGLVGLFLAGSAVGARVAVAGSRAAPTVPPYQISRHYSVVSFPSRVDRLRMSGWLLRADRPSGRSLILVHGWQGNREDVDFVPIARQMLARGYDVLMFDLRASGASQGSTQTFGHDEPRDLLGAYDFMVDRGYAPERMAILGNSMGAATVIEAAPQLTGVAALVSDSAFADLGTAMEGAVTRFTGLPGMVAVPAMAFARTYGVRTTVRPEAVVRTLPCRAFLFIHARGDRLIPVSNVRALAAASANRASEVLVLDGKDHMDTYTHDPARFIAAVTTFVDGQIAAAVTVGERAPLTAHRSPGACAGPRQGM